MTTQADILECVLTCPNCGAEHEETMPTDSFRFFYVCTNCNEQLRPQEGDCCVFCSYGSVDCPPVQQDGCCT